jgi:hypothetical protein
VWAAKGYNESMKTIRHKLLLKGGFDLKVVADVTKAGSKDAHKSPLDFSSLDDSPKKKFAEVRDRTIPPLPDRGEDVNPKQLRYDELTRLEAAQEVAEQDLLFPPEPPASLLEAGGHLVLAIVSDTTTTCNDEAPPRIGVEPFMHVVQDACMKGMTPIPVVILAICMPSNWHTVCDNSRLFWVKGTAMHLHDLKRVGYKQARAIAICRGHSGEGSRTTKVADARVLLAANLVEAHLPHDTPTRVITDHGYNSSCELLPKTHAPIEAKFNSEACVIGNPGQTTLSGLIASLSAGSGNPQSKGSLGYADRVGDDLGLHSGPCDEDYEDLGVQEYAYHPRYMRGQIFVAAIMPTLVANTLYNPTIARLVEGLLRAPMVLVPLPYEWERRYYSEFTVWLFRQSELLPLGLYRSAAAAEANQKGKPVDESAPTHHFVYTAPDAHKVRLIRTDRIICVTRGTAQDN